MLMERNLLALCADGVRREMPTNFSALAFSFFFSLLALKDLCAGTTQNSQIEQKRQKPETTVTSQTRGRTNLPCKQKKGGKKMNQKSMNMLP